MEYLKYNRLIYEFLNYNLRVLKLILKTYILYILKFTKFYIYVIINLIMNSNLIIILLF